VLLLAEGQTITPSFLAQLKTAGGAVASPFTIEIARICAGESACTAPQSQSDRDGVNVPCTRGTDRLDDVIRGIGHWHPPAVLQGRMRTPRTSTSTAIPLQPGPQGEIVDLGVPNELSWGVREGCPRAGASM